MLNVHIHRVDKMSSVAGNNRYAVDASELQIPVGVVHDVINFCDGFDFIDLHFRNIDKHGTATYSSPMHTHELIVFND